jgi:recombination protein RecR
VNTYPSKLLEEAVNELTKLPGIGRKTALRLALYLLKEDHRMAESLGNILIRMRNETGYCRICNNISDTDICQICSSPKRNRAVICVVEDTRDVMAIENTGQYNGVYHVLGGVISPMDGISPSDLNVDGLVDKVGKEEIEEVIFALPATIEGDTTNFYLFKKLGQYPVRFSLIARGVAVGDELEYADEVTLGRSIIHRTPYESVLSR